MIGRRFKNEIEGPAGRNIDLVLKISFSEESTLNIREIFPTDQDMKV
jgi:hypothetical protein